MSTPKLTNWSFKTAIPQFIVLSLAISISVVLWPNRSLSESLMFGAFGYLGYSYLSRYTISRHHRAGIRAFQNGDYSEALEHYAKSKEFFERYPAIDRFRSVIMLTPSIWSYREMAMMNSAFAHSQIGDDDRSRQLYEEVLRDYPDNTVAVQALRMLNSTDTKK